MSLRNLPSKTLREALRLIERRDTLLQQIAQVESQLAALERAQPAPAAAPKSVPAVKSARAKAGGRRKMKNEVVALLQGAGSSGMAVSELAGRLGVGVNRIFTWFYSTGKNVRQIKKIANARYRWVG